MRKSVLSCLIATLALVCLGCGNGSDFQPVVGPFSGTLQTASGPVGQFTFTYTDGLLGGTGAMTIDGNLVPVSFSAVVNGKTLSGELRNATLGGGEVTGIFLDAAHGSGSFEYVDTAETIHLTGTWTAVATVS
jgi:hypothetical protein